MGFGHRVYKNYDPRAAIVKKSADEVLSAMGKRDDLLDIAMELEQVALEDDYFVERKLYPNVDFYTGLIYRAMGFPTKMFTVLFAIGRLPGWIAQWHEMINDPQTRIGRPRQLYTGAAGAALRPDREAVAAPARDPGRAAGDHRDGSGAGALMGPRGAPSRPAGGEGARGWPTTSAGAACRPSGTPSTATPEGRLYFEELMGEEGFSSDSSLLYHREIPSALVDARGVGAARPADDAERAAAAATPAAARAVRAGRRRRHRRGDRPPAGARQRRRPHLLRRGREASPLYRNAVGDECVYVESGAATVETVFGAAGGPQGDYVLLPRATTHRWVPPATSRCGRTASRRTSTSRPRGATCRGSVSCSSTRPYCERDLHGPG